MTSDDVTVCLLWIPLQESKRIPIPGEGCGPLGFHLRITPEQRMGFAMLSLAICIAPRREAVSLTQPWFLKLPQKTSDIHKKMVSLAYSSSISCPISLRLSLSLSHTPIVRLSDDKKRCRIPSGWHWTPCRNLVVYGESGDGKEGAEEGENWERSRAYRSREHGASEASGKARAPVGPTLPGAHV